ncbi:uncharacterized protein F4822DRAFT_43875 [Hypoxylon trugodes]|uniref:uncharacterized protein n=1 Tax=Hypoxylon trugodes TaxID=326681 RepID=UPI0021921C9A|nr:uncharacterized protein F4822DRAFT_43875 [Hypoxylon trugodes]KAI1394281.1 hypothetical protein F4822DRAFT_43875 [Hypoxylon trugodes]
MVRDASLESVLPFQGVNMDEGIDSIQLDFKNPLPWVMTRHRLNIIKCLSCGPRGDANEARQMREIGDRHFRIHLVELHRMRLRTLQCKLVGHSVNMRFKNGENVAGWEKDLKEYVEALRDYDYIQECAQRDRDPFYVTAERITDDEIMQAAIEHINLGLFNPLNDCRPIEKWETVNTPIGGTRGEHIKRTWLGKFIWRLIFAIFGSGFLIGPMWLMVLHNSRIICLASTTGFVALFGFIMAMLLEKNIDVLSSTSAYAAVLVVFVGLAVQQ